ncbi:MAG: sensor histidine kinase [Betaproteobacteria bacterium]|nr:MAG: sensor histidine kinase [Betaproteobacteria bacterium]
MRPATLDRLLPRTLHGRLLVSLAGSLIALLAISVVADYRTALGLANEAYDRALASTAIALASRLERDADDERIEIDLPPAAEAVLRSDPEDSVLYAVVDEAGRLVAGDAALAALPWPVASAQPAYADGRLGERALRMASYAYSSPTLRATVVVAETTVKRERSAHGILSAIIWPNLLLIAATLGLVFVVVRFALRPLDVLGERIDARTADDLSPVADAGVPGEARPLVAALNRLLSNLDVAGRAQQAFLSNAAHQLRTPLAGMLMQLELLNAALPAELQPRVERLRVSAQRLTRLTNQMLALARSSRQAASMVEGLLRPLDLATLIEERASDFADRALARGIDLAFEPARASVQGSDWMLRELISNLLDNAIKYTPPGGHVTLRCGEDGAGHPWLEVEDDGPGIPPADRERVFERFQRLAGAEVEGSGLGLAIVREVAGRHQATVTIESGGSGAGTRIRVCFPARR